MCIKEYKERKEWFLGSRKQWKEELVKKNVRKKEGNKLLRPECDSYISSPSSGGGVNRERQKKIRFAPPPDREYCRAGKRGATWGV